MIIKMPSAFDSVIQGPVLLRLQYFMWYPATSLGNLFQNLAVPTEYFSDWNNIFPISRQNFLWSNLCPLVLFVTVHPETWYLQKGCPLSSLWLLLKCWEAVARFPWACSSSGWTTPPPLTRLHIFQPLTTLVALHQTLSNFSVPRGQELNKSAQ